MTITAGTLLARKVLTAFILGALTYAVPRVLDGLDVINATGNYDIDRSVVITFAAGALSAAIRYALAVSPININPTDSTHTVGAGHSETVRIVKDSDTS